MNTTDFEAADRREMDAMIGGWEIMYHGECMLCRGWNPELVDFDIFVLHARAVVCSCEGDRHLVFNFTCTA